MAPQGLPKVYPRVRRWLAQGFPPTSRACELHIEQRRSERLARRMPDALARELLADLLHDAEAYPVHGFEPQRCRRLARALRTEGAEAPAVQAATAAALQLARIDGPHRWAWSFWASKTPATDLQRWQARHLVESWTASSEAVRPA